MSKKKYVKLINDERTDINIASDKACDNTSIDVCSKLDYASCTVYSYDVCGKDYDQCSYYLDDFCENRDAY